MRIFPPLVLICQVETSSPSVLVIAASRRDLPANITSFLRSPVTLTEPIVKVVLVNGKGARAVGGWVVCSRISPANSRLLAFRSLRGTLLVAQDPLDARDGSNTQEDLPKS